MDEVLNFPSKYVSPYLLLPRRSHGEALFAASRRKSHVSTENKERLKTYRWKEKEHQS